MPTRTKPFSPEEAREAVSWLIDWAAGLPDSVDADAALYRLARLEATLAQAAPAPGEGG